MDWTVVIILTIAILLALLTAKVFFAGKFLLGVLGIVVVVILIAWIFVRALSQGFGG